MELGEVLVISEALIWVRANDVRFSIMLNTLLDHHRNTSLKGDVTCSDLGSIYNINF